MYSSFYLFRNWEISLKSASSSNESYRRSLTSVETDKGFIEHGFISEMGMGPQKSSNLDRFFIETNSFQHRVLRSLDRQI
jgi:hypothetical protein